MILLLGIPTEPPLARVQAALAEIGARFWLWNQRTVGRSHVQVSLRDGRIGGEIEVDGACCDLGSVDAAFPRLMDPSRLPEAASADPAALERSEVAHQALHAWLEAAPCVVVNRGRPQGSNSSKPYQAQRIREVGFRTPETLITNDPDAVRDFQRRHRRIVYKSMSGVRSIVTSLDGDALERLERIRWCPVQFQAFVEGVNVRVHTIGAATVFATAIRSAAVDYRYGDAVSDDGVELAPFDLPRDVAERCTELAARLGLHIAGIDLKIGPSGEVWCFEVNPSPAFSYYEASTGQPIAASIARYLAGELPRHDAFTEARLPA